MPEIIINGPEGRLQTRYMSAGDPTAPIALILHGDPSGGGHMGHPITVRMYKLFLKNEFSVLRFNFRGIGRSQGNVNKDYENIDGEVADAAVALDWIQAQCTNARSCWICGFSFGALIGMQLMMRRPEVGHFVAVNLPVTKNDFSFLAPCPSPGLVVHGTENKEVSAAQVADTIEKMPEGSKKVTFRPVDGAGKFFVDRLDPLMNEIETYIQAITSGEMV